MAGRVWKRRRVPSFAMMLLTIVISLLIDSVTAGDHLTYDGNYIQSSCDQEDCLRCDLPTGLCLKCLHVMMEGTHACMTQCPSGHATTIRDDQLYKGSVCTPGSLLSAVTGRDIAVIACAAAGGAVCVGIILGAILYARRQAALKPVPEDSHVRKIHVPRLWRDPRPSAAETSVSADERKEFLKALSCLRRSTPLLLEMLAETRARFSGIRGSDYRMDTKARAYRAVVRDLNRVVALIARRDDSFSTVPADWRRLLAWADRLLARYRRTRDNKCGECGECEQLSKESTSNALTTAVSQSQQQPLFLTRQQAQEQRWRKQMEESRRLSDEHQVKIQELPAFSPKALSEILKEEDEELGGEEEATFSPDLSQEVSSPSSYLQMSPSFKPPSLLLSTTQEEAEVSYSQDEQALAHQKKTQYSVVDERTDNKLCDTSDGRRTNSTSKSKSKSNSPSMITRIFRNKILNSSDLCLDESDLKTTDSKAPCPNVLQEEECSSSIYDHIEAFTFDDFNPTSKSFSKTPKTSQKIKNTANVNSNRLRKPNFPGYSESFKQILDKRNILNIQKNKIQKRLSRKGEQLHKIVKRSESRLFKDRSKMDPNLTYDRRNVKSDVVNEEMLGGDVYVAVVKQPVIERKEAAKEELHSNNSGSYKNFDDISYEGNNNNNNNDANIRCEILTVV